MIPTIARKESGEPAYAGFWIRFVAVLIDSIVLNLAAWLMELAVVGAYYWIARFGARGGEVAPVAPIIEQVIAVICYLILAGIYYTLGHYRFGTTLGKRPLNIYVVDAESHSPVSFGQSLLRTVAYGLSYVPFGAGYLMAAFHPRKQALHDVIARTVSVRGTSASRSVQTAAAGETRPGAGSGANEAERD